MALSPQAVGLSEVSPAMKGTVMPAAPQTANNAVLTIYDRAIPGTKPLQFCRIQNQSTQVVYVAINDVPSAVVYNQTLKACTGAKDGTGGIFELFGGLQVQTIKVFAAAAYEVSSIVGTNPNNCRIGL